MENVVVSVLGSKKDMVGYGKKRWYRWRPNLSILMHHEFPVHELVLIYHASERGLLDFTIADMAEISPQTRITSYCVDYENAWDFGQVYGQLRDIMQIHPFNPEQQRYYTHIVTGTHVVRICLFLLAEANYIPGKLMQTMPSSQGAHGTYQLIDLDLSRYDELAARFQRDSQVAVAYLKEGIDTCNAAFNAMMDQLEQVSLRSSAPILLTGPTGAGKSRLAKRIFELKQRQGQLSGALVEVNCATLRGDHAMSALFGHSKGAFTGALNTRQGLLREANKGLLFLDEIGELGLDEQAMLLRAIEDKIFMPFGSDVAVSSDFQLIAGTNRDLHQQVIAGQFREDLLARINLWTYRMPSLKERIEDFNPNLDYELQRFTQMAGHKVSFSKVARAHYVRFAHADEALWRANFRDLNSSMTRMATLAQGGRITEAIVTAEIQRLRQDWQAYQPHTKITASQKEQGDVLVSLLSEAQIAEVDVFDQVQLAEVIRVCRSSKSLADAGRKLFNVSRTKRASNNDSHRLRVYLQKFGLNFDGVQE